ncbi:MAG: acyl carrier protein phosphodiesterase [Flavobacterium sp.]|nr:acyl carrier protein phosphodiesterase [Flavobacterium sp.]
MNFLAHIYLSGDDELIKIGNFMADGIRGKDYLLLPLKVQKGVLLHRNIDSFTDVHPVFRKSTQRLHANYHHYAGVIVDVFYDHFLAKNWTLYSTIPLENYVDDFYQSLSANREILTSKTLQLMPYMIAANWLVSYRTIAGISRILLQMDQRTKNKSGMGRSVSELRLHYELFEQEFFTFFDDVMAFADLKIKEL